ncbi:hypothetical protein M0638_07055 [Roseomonas sp. NAR14]|uniref:Uncharacterized protein n=1 Tax=Roseomonas acroporae TaxID=2937791 RepID=A0A9X1Y6R3_9PROT|nr:hypothetical protein [Roseomonas acroporae]MCK8784133.1 hypothetical protein [Roseomonas acroporae]
MPASSTPTTAPPTVQQLRQHDGSVAGVSAALKRVQDAAEWNAVRIAELQAARSALVRDGTAEQIEAGERGERLAHILAEQLAAGLSELQQDLEAAYARAAAAHAQRLTTTARAAEERFRLWVEAEYLKHAEAIAEGIRLEREAEQAQAAAVEAWSALRRHPGYVEPPPTRAPPPPPRPRAFMREQYGRSFALTVALPSLKPGTAPVAMPPPPPSGGERDAYML